MLFDLKRALGVHAYMHAAPLQMGMVIVIACPWLGMSCALEHGIGTAMIYRAGCACIMRTFAIAFLLPMRDSCWLLHACMLCTPCFQHGVVFVIVVFFAIEF